MGVSKYMQEGQRFWKVDLWLTLPDGRASRFRKKKIPTKEQAEALVSKVKTEAFEGRYFDRVRVPKITVTKAWEDYEPVSKRDNDTWQSEAGRAKHLKRILGPQLVASLTVKDIDEYRTKRGKDITQRGAPPQSATLDLEVELLKRIINYAVASKILPANPIASVKLLRKSNVRKSVIDEATFSKLHAEAEDFFKPIILVAYDTGMRKSEVLDLKWSQVQLKDGTIRLSADDTKTENPRIICLTQRVIEMLKKLPRRLGCDFVFPNPETKKPWNECRKVFQRACRKAGLEGAWFHDLRRSFVTNSRRRGVPESVVMKMSGHKTRAVFDRYNIVEEEDLRAAVKKIEAGIATDLGHVLDTAGKKGD